jgi:hypothetical protein
MAVPMTSSDEMERLCIDDVVEKDSVKFEDLNIKPFTVEETVCFEGF